MGRLKTHWDEIDIEGQRVPVLVRLNPRARKLIVQLNQQGDIVVVSPSKRSIPRAMEFAREHTDWLARQLSALPDPRPFCDGATIPYLGIAHLIRHAPAARRGVYFDTPPTTAATKPSIIVSGRQEFLHRRLSEWLRAQAKKELGRSCKIYSDRLGLAPAVISVRDSRTRWGSCAATGNLSFSWRLIFAPHFVLDYVAAHETAHRKYMSHGPRFWQLVDRLTPMRRDAEQWLSGKGNDLHRIGMKGREFSR